MDGDIGRISVVWKQLIAVGGNMNTVTWIALLGIALGILIPIIVNLRRRSLGRVRIDLDGPTQSPDSSIMGTVHLRMARPGRSGPVRLTLRCTERLDGDGQPTSGVRAEETWQISDGLDFAPGEERKVPFELSLPGGSRVDAHTIHATRGTLPSVMRRDYDWWCIAEAETSGGVTLRAIERINLVRE
ncbi:hypothetical protein [Roseobacter sp. HKCCA0434]|uniref:hypothetical protein n=1 Tax=Roseobacter sp. HKCCA0434 TaxID=3079297 RepID=UPI002905A373|nr:hypothetical protein [Roseobacter sp. HKCCA0434]